MRAKFRIQTYETTGEWIGEDEFAGPGWYDYGIVDTRADMTRVRAELERDGFTVRAFQVSEVRRAS